MGHLVPSSLLVTLPKLKNLKMKAVATQLSYEQVMKAKGIGCDICTLVVTEIDKLIVADQTLDELIVLVEGLCSAIDGLFPGAGATCNALVESYLPQIVEGLVNNQLSPASVCGLLTLCP